MIRNTLILIYLWLLKLSFTAKVVQDRCLYNANMTAKSLAYYVNTTQQPCMNFYNYACGNYERHVEEQSEVDENGFMIENYHDFERFKYRALRGDFDSQYPSLQKINRMTEKCEVYTDEVRENCFKKVEHFGLYAFVSIFTKQLTDSYDYNHHYNVFEKLFNANKFELLNMVNEQKDFLHKGSRNKFVKRLQLLKFYRGHNERLRDVNFMEKCYEFFEFSTNTTIPDMLKDIDNYNCMIPSDNKNWEICVDYITHHLSGIVKLEDLIHKNIHYNYHSNRFMVNPIIIRHPCFDCRFPKSLQHGCIGYLIGRELVSIIDYRLRTFDFLNEKHANKNETYKLEKAYLKKRKCFEDQYNNDTMKEKIRVENSTALIDYIVADNGGLKTIYNAYIRYFENLRKKNRVRVRVPGFESLTPEQLFFLNYARSYCHHFDDNKKATIIEPHDGLNGHIRLKISLSNFEPFAKAYNCGVDSPYVSKNQCSVW